MPIKLGRRKQKRASSEDDMSTTKVDDEFKSKLNLLLRTPQAREIQRRSWRVSDKFMGGKTMEKYREDRDKTRRKHRNSISEDDMFEKFSSSKKSSRSKKHTRKNRRRKDSSF